VPQRTKVWRGSSGYDRVAATFLYLANRRSRVARCRGDASGDPFTIARACGRLPNPGRRVGELDAAIGQPAGLVAHHRTGDWVWVLRRRCVRLQRALGRPQWEWTWICLEPAPIAPLTWYCV